MSASMIAIGPSRAAGGPAVHVYELDGPTRAYAPIGIVRDVLRLAAPFPIEIALGDLLPG